MDLIDELRSERAKERPPGKRGVSAYLTPQQYERLELLSEKAGKSYSKLIGRLIDMATERMSGKGG